MHIMTATAATPKPETQPQGNFVAFLVRDKQPGDNKPIFEGRLALPDTDAEFAFPLWGHEYADPKTGEVKTMFNGSTDPVSPHAAPMDQIAALLKSADATTALTTIGNLQLRSRQLVLFPNRFKEEAADKNRPNYWGAYAPGNDLPAVRISAWMRKDRYGRAYLSGTTSYPLPGKTEAQQQDLTPTLEQLEAEGLVPHGMPSKAKSKSAGRAR